jgi:hypothetical protein
MVRPACSCVSNRLGESNNFPLKNLDGLPQGVTRQHFALKRHLLRASLYRKQLAARFAAWHRFTEATHDPSVF